MAKIAGPPLKSRGKATATPKPKTARARLLEADRVQGISKAVTKRLAHRGGAKRVAATIYDDARVILRSRMEDVVGRLAVVADGANRKTVTAEDVDYVTNNLRHTAGQSHRLEMTVAPLPVSRPRPVAAAPSTPTITTSHHHSNAIKIIRSPLTFTPTTHRQAFTSSGDPVSPSDSPTPRRPRTTPQGIERHRYTPSRRGLTTEDYLTMYSDTHLSDPPDIQHRTFLPSTPVNRQLPSQASGSGIASSALWSTPGTSAKVVRTMSRLQIVGGDGDDSD